MSGPDPPSGPESGPGPTSGPESGPVSLSTQFGHDVLNRVVHGGEISEVFVVNAEADGTFAQFLFEGFDELDQS